MFKHFLITSFVAILLEMLMLLSSLPCVHLRSLHKILSSALISLGKFPISKSVLAILNVLLSPRI